MLLLALTLISGLALQLINPQILRRFIDTAVSGAARESLPFLALSFIGLALLQRILAAASRYLADDVGWTATNRLRRELIAHLLRLDPGFHKGHTPGELIERVEGDVSLLATFFARMILDLLSNGLLLVAILLLLAREEWRAGAIMALFAAVAMAVLAAIRQIAVPHYRSLRALLSDFFGFVGETLVAREDVRSSGAEGHVMSRFYDFQRRLLPARLRAARRSFTIFGTGLTLTAIGSALALGTGAWLYRQELITIGTVYLIFHYAELLNQPIREIRQQVQELQSAAAGLTRVEEILAQSPRVVDGPGTELPAGALSVACDQVSFRYDESTPVLRNLSFTLQPGRVLGLLGRTGSGKSTLSRLLLRLYDPSAGELRLGGVETRQTHISHLRRRVGMVSQEVQLFEATVRDNLTFFDPSIPDGRLLSLLDEVGLTPWLQRQPLGLDTMLGSGGTSLSAGEAQLLAFARLFLQDPGLIILDEASSRLDPATEALTERAVTRLLQGRTAIIIAHRLATVDRADEILILEDGAMVEHGERRLLADDPNSRFHRLRRAGLTEVLAG